MMLGKGLRGLRGMTDYSTCDPGMGTCGDSGTGSPFGTVALLVAAILIPVVLLTKGGSRS